MLRAPENGINAANRRQFAANGLAIPVPRHHTAAMLTQTKTALLIWIVASSTILVGQTATAPASSPAYTSDSQMKFPVGYRQWVYLTTGFDMSYNPALQNSDHHMFDNVFVNPEAYRTFVETGTWPDKTILVLEARGAEGKGSINQKGNFQGTDVMATEVHVKDEARFPGKWAFFGFDDGKTAAMIPQSASCYSCHAEHGAVDTTFVQFYPTLLPIAKAKATLSPSYLKETTAQK
jgi:cytochrome P460